MALLSLCGLLFGGSLPAASAQLWTESSMTKVFRDSEPPSDSSKQVKVELAGGRNSNVATQLVIRAEETTLKNVEINISPLDRYDGEWVIPSSCIDICKVHYVHLPHPHRSRSKEAHVEDKLDVKVFPESKPRDYPDALPPLTEPFTVEAYTAQPIWIALTIPKDTLAGSYQGEITVETENGFLYSVPFDLQVWDFTLPDKPSVRSLVSGYDAGLHHEGVDDNTPESEVRALRQEYYEFWLERRISGQSLPVELDSKEATSYYRDPRMTAFRIGPGNRKGSDPARYHQLLDRWERDGALEKALLRVTDEPSREGNFDNILKAAQRHPQLQQIVCFNRTVPGDWANGKNFFDLLHDKNSKWGMVKTHMVFCPILNLFDKTTIRKKAAEHQDNGGEVWWYQASWPKPPYPTLFVDAKGIETRIIFWQKWQHNIDGFLLYGGSRWRDTNPWEDAAVRSKWPNLYGCGYLTYPGKPVGMKGPISSIRLENMRHGIEDHMYLTLVAEHADKETADEFIRKLNLDFKNYTRSPDNLEEIRREIGEWLHKNISQN